MTTQLQAVNRALFRIGQRAIDGLDGPLNQDHLAALTALDMARTDLLSEGWSFNTVREITLTPNGDGEILVPHNLMDWEIDRNSGVDARDYTVQGGKFIHTKTQSSVFTGGIKFRTLVYDLAFDDMPPIARLYVAKRAEREFAFNRLRDEALRVPSAAEAQYRAQLMRSNLTDNRPSMFRDPSVREAAGEGY